MNFTLLGIMFGFLFVLTSLIVGITTLNNPFSFTGIYQVHTNYPIQWIVDSAPIVLGILMHIIGRSRRKNLRLIKLLEKRIINESSVLNGITEGTDNLIFAVDKNRQLMHFNSAFENLLSVNKIIPDKGMNIDEIVEKNILPKECDALVTLALANNGGQKEVRFTNENIESVCQVNYMALKSGAKITGAALIFSNITELVKAIEEKSGLEAQIESMKLKEDFMANINHEIRTPLNAILGLLDPLKDQIKNEAAFEYLNTINNSSKDLLRIINDTLDFNRIKEGKFNIQPEPNNLYKLVSSISKKYKLRAAENQLDFFFDFEGDQESILEFDAPRLEQSICNLLSNAVKFSDPGGDIALKIMVRPRGEKYAKVDIWVKDKGIGIDQDQLPFIFEPYKQIENPLTKTTDGTGLGLSLVNELIHLMGGDIQVQSEKGKGSTFILSCIFKLGEQAPKTTHVDYSTINALIVDDKEINLKVAGLMLNKLGISFTTALSGFQAIEMVEQNPNINLIFMDLQMPEMSGMETTKKILFKNEQPPKVVALTATHFDGIETELEKEGFSGYLAKPLSVEKLERELSKFFG